MTQVLSIEPKKLYNKILMHFSTSPHVFVSWGEKNGIKFVKFL